VKTLGIFDINPLTVRTTTPECGSCIRSTIASIWHITDEHIHSVSYSQHSGHEETEAWSQRPTGFLQCLHTVGWVIWPVKTIHKMTYCAKMDVKPLLTYHTTVQATCRLQSIKKSSAEPKLWTLSVFFLGGGDPHRPHPFLWSPDHQQVRYQSLSLPASMTSFTFFITVDWKESWGENVS